MNKLLATLHGIRLADPGNSLKALSYVRPAISSTLFSLFRALSTNAEKTHFSEIPSSVVTTLPSYVRWDYLVLAVFFLAMRLVLSNSASFRAMIFTRALAVN
jgi:hypothetical protein